MEDKFKDQIFKVECYMRKKYGNYSVNTVYARDYSKTYIMPPTTRKKFMMRQQEYRHISEFVYVTNQKTNEQSWLKCIISINKLPEITLADRTLYGKS